MTVYVVTHPEVVVDPAVAVPRWGLSDAGWRRVGVLLTLPWVSGLTGVASSDEHKALQTAKALAAPLALDVLVEPGLGENDRSATGFLPPAEFEVTAEEFFAHPSRSVRGWETAEDAQRRMVAAVARVTSGVAEDCAVVAHGGVGTLLLCHLLGRPVDRSLDQPGQGSYFAYDAATGQVRHGWRRIGG